MAGEKRHGTEKYTVSYFKQDAVVRSHDPCPQPSHLKEVTRGLITELSKKSRARLAFYAANTEVVFRSMTTCTVHSELGINSGSEFKLAMRPMLQSFRNRKNEFLWFLEFTKKGAPHIHILSDWIPESGSGYRGSHLKNPVFLDESRKQSAKWTKFVSKAIGANDQAEMFDNRTEMLDKMSRASVRVEPIREQDGAARYVCKYAYKCEQKQVPYKFSDVGRFWSNSRGVTPTRIGVETLTWSELEKLNFKFFEVHNGDMTYGGPMAVQFGKGEADENRA